MKAKIFKTNGEIIEVEPKNGTDFKLPELQKIVGGYIEIVNLTKDRIMVVNEEGKIYGLDINSAATELLVQNGGCDIVVGNVLVCDSNMVK